MAQGRIPDRLIRTGHTQRILGVAGEDPASVGVGFLEHAWFVAEHPERARMLEEGRRLSPHVGFNYVLRGRGEHTGWDGVTRPLHPGVLFQLDVSRPCRLRREPDYAECYVVLDLRLHEALQRLHCVPTGCWWRDLGARRSVVAGFAALERSAADRTIGDAGFMRRLLGLLERLLSAGHRRLEQDALVQRAQDLLGRDLDRGLGIGTVAQRFGLSRDRFARRFHAATGVSPKAYRVGKRLEEACRLLATRTPTQVAHDLGYRSLAFFSRQFKAHLGKSPSAYAEQEIHGWAGGPAPVTT